MKSAYVKPEMNMEAFQANEYVAACFTVNCIGTTTYYAEGGERTHTCDGKGLTFFNNVHGQGGKNISTTGDSAYLITNTAEGSFWADVQAADSFEDYAIIFLKALFGGYRNSTDDVYIHNGHVSQTQTLYSNGASSSI